MSYAVCARCIISTIPFSLSPSRSLRALRSLSLSLPLELCAMLSLSYVSDWGTKTASSRRRRRKPPAEPSAAASQRRTRAAPRREEEPPGVAAQRWTRPRSASAAEVRSAMATGGGTSRRATRRGRGRRAVLGVKHPRIAVPLVHYVRAAAPRTSSSPRLRRPLPEAPRQRTAGSPRPRLGARSPPHPRLGARSPRSRLARVDGGRCIFCVHERAPYAASERRRHFFIPWKT